MPNELNIILLIDHTLREWIILKEFIYDEKNTRYKHRYIGEKILKLLI